MLQPSIACCYEEIVRRSDSTALVSMGGIFLHTKLPCLGALWFRIVSEGFFICIASPDRWGKTRVEFVTLTGLRKSGETTNMVILITDGVGESDLGLVTVFCHPNQARMEACGASPPCVSTIHLSKVLWWWEGIPTLPTSLGECPMHFIWIWALSLGELLLPISL